MPQTAYLAIKKFFQKWQFFIFLSRLNKILPLSAFKKHGYIVASSWCGKSEFIKTLIYREILEKHPSSAIIVIDPHGDMVEEIAKLSEFSNPKKAKRLVYIDPTLKSGYSPSINPFELDDHSDENIALMTQELKSIITVLLQWSSTTNQMDAILSPCIATLLRKKNSSFAELQRFMDDSNNSDLIELGKNSPNPQHQLLFKNKFNSSLFNVTKHWIYTRMQVLLNDPTFQNLVSNKTSLSLKRLIDEKKIILFKLSLGNSWSESIQSYWRFIVGLLRIIAFQRSSLPHRIRMPTYLFIDEFQNFISDDIEKALTQLRKYGLHMILSNQYVGQEVSTSLQKALFSSWVKIAGRNDKKSLSAIWNEMNISVDDLKKVRVGEFYIQSSNQVAKKIRAPKMLLGNNHAMTNQSWAILKDENLKKYYSKISQPDEEIKYTASYSAKSIEDLTAKYWA